MNILLAFKAEPDAGMLAEKEWQAAQGNSGPDVSLLRSLLGADEQAAAALLLAQRKNGTSMSLTALSMGDERALHWLRYLMALGFEDAVLLETAAVISATFSTQFGSSGSTSLTVVAIG